jgi:hypothetical protein
MTLMERILIKLGIAPKPMFDTCLNMGRAKAILIANKIGVFEKLSSHPMSAQELAEVLNCNQRGIAILLDALAKLGYLKRRGDRFRNAKVAQKWLVEGSAQYMGNLLCHFDDIWALATNADEATKLGKPPVNLYDYMSERPEAWRNFILGQKDIAVASVNEILSKVKAPTQARRLLDLGGGHGYHSIAFCRKYPGLTALVFDLENAVKVGLEVVAQEKMDSRVSFKVGNYITDEIGSDYEIALLFAILHGDPPETNIATVNKVYEALNPGGVIAINEILSYKGKRESELGFLMALNMLVSTPRGLTYAYDVVKCWLKDAGFININRVDLRRMPGYSLVLATKPT